MNKHYLAETQREIVDWQGVTLTQENAGKHGRIVLHYKGESRIVIVSNTPSDGRAIKNHIATVRRELRGLGATKTIAPANPNQRERQHNKPVRFAVPSSLAAAQKDPFEILEPAMTQNPIAAIFASIDRLRYSEMLELAQILSEVAVETALRRSNVNDWATALQCAADAAKSPTRTPSAGDAQ